MIVANALLIHWLLACSPGQARPQANAPRRGLPVPPPHLLAHVALGCERTGVHLDIVAIGPGLPMEIFQRLQLSAQRRRFIVGSLNDLRGYVRIQSSDTALRYVRLHTAPHTWFAWARPSMAEIVDTVELSTQPNYGIRGPGLSTGALSPAEFTSMGFTRPSVTRTDRGFRIERWVLYRDTPLSLYIQKVVEAVGSDGSYRRTVQQSRRAPPYFKIHFLQFM